VRYSIFIVNFLVLSTLCGCVSEQIIYSSGQNWQRNECSKLADNQARELCTNKANMSYDTYKQEVK